MPRTLADAASKGWAVIGAAAEADAVPISQFQVERPTILVMGESTSRQQRLWVFAAQFAWELC